MRMFNADFCDFRYYHSKWIFGLFEFLVVDSIIFFLRDIYADEILVISFLVKHNE